MSEDAIADSPTPEPLLATGPSWLSIFAGMSSVATLVVLAGILAVRFYENRPANLTEPSTRLAQLIERSLDRHYVSSAATEVETTDEQSEDGTVWKHYRYDVPVPERLDPAGVGQLIRKDLERYNLLVQGSDGDRNLKIWLANYEIAAVTLRSAPSGTAGKADLRVASTQIAAEAGAALTTMGVPEEVRYTAEPRLNEDNDARWYVTSIEAALPADATAEDLLAALSHHIQFTGAHIRPGLQQGNRLPVEVRYRDRVCVALSCELNTVGGLPEGLPRPGEEPTLNETVSRMLAEAPETVEPKMPASAAPEIVPTDASLAESAAETEATSDKALLAKLPVPPEPRGVSSDVDDPVMAIVLDDGGYGGMVTERILKLDPALTLSILPNTPHGEDTAQRAAALGFEVLLHMPMESQSQSTNTQSL